MKVGLMRILIHWGRPIPDVIYTRKAHSTKTNETETRLFASYIKLHKNYHSTGKKKHSKPSCEMYYVAKHTHTHKKKAHGMELLAYWAITLTSASSPWSPVKGILKATTTLSGKNLDDNLKGCPTEITNVERKVYYWAPHWCVFFLWSFPAVMTDIKENEERKDLQIHENICEIQDTIMPCKYKVIGCEDKILWLSMKKMTNCIFGDHTLTEQWSCFVKKVPILYQRRGRNEVQYVANYKPK